MNPATFLQRIVTLLDQCLMPRASNLPLRPVCAHIEPDMGIDNSDKAHDLPIAAVKQVLYFNRVIVLSAVTSVLFFIMSMTVGIDAMLQGETS